MTSKTAKGFPPQIRYIIGNEACERFSYYGMRAILVVFMVEHLKFAKADATATYHLFVSACYLFPVLGAWIADRYWGKYKTIMILSLGYCLGHGALAAFENETGLYWGLFLIALGAGGIKPCVSAFVGDQFTASNKDMVKSVFDLFYFSVNFGSFFATLLIPYMLPRVGAAWAFGLPGILMGLATLVLWVGRATYINVPPQGKGAGAGFPLVLGYALLNSSKRKPGQELLDAALGKYSAEDVEGAKAAWSLVKLFSTISIFWALFDQHGSSWVLQAKQMNLNFLGIQFEASQISALNPILVMMLIPAFSFYLYPLAERLTGYTMTPLRRIGSGMSLAAFSFVAAGAVQTAINGGAVPSIGWQFIQYIIITMSEVMISITGLEFAYTQAPRSMKSTIMSLWLLSIFAGNLLTAYIAKVNVFPVESSGFYFFFAALMASVTVIFIWSAVRYKVRDYMEKDQPSSAPSAGPALAADAAA